MEGVRRLSRGCGEAVWRVSECYLECVGSLSERCGRLFGVERLSSPLLLKLSEGCVEAI